VWPAGQYILLYDGNGTLGFTGDAAVTSSAPGRLVLQITPSSGFYLRITKTDDADPVRNIRIVPTAYEQTYAAQVFTPKFLDQVSGVCVLCVCVCLHFLFYIGIADKLDGATHATHRTPCSLLIVYAICCTNNTPADCACAYTSLSHVMHLLISMPLDENNFHEFYVIFSFSTPSNCCISGHMLIVHGSDYGSHGLLLGFNTLRFTRWQKIWGDERNTQMLRNWATRTTPKRQTQMTPDGIAVEHMVQLANKVID
jgi:hypothetical protein